MFDLFYEADVQSPMISPVIIPSQTDQVYNDYGAISESSSDDLSFATEQSAENPIIVYGARNDGRGFWFEFSSLSNIDGYPTVDETYDSGGGGGEIPSYFDFLQAECQADLTTDLVARQIEALIKAQPDWNAREYGAVIYMVGNEVRMGPLVRGMTVAEARDAGLPAPETRLGFPSDLGDGVILAVVHSHPDIGYDDRGDLENYYPSDRPDSGDYYGFEQFVGSDSRFGNNAAFAQYILGPDGVLREFNFSDGRVTRANDTDPGSRSNLAKDRPCVG